MLNKSIPDFLVTTSGFPRSLEHHPDEGLKMPLEQMFYVSNGQCYLEKIKDEKE